MYFKALNFFLIISLNVAPDNRMNRLMVFILLLLLLSFFNLPIRNKIYVRWLGVESPPVQRVSFGDFGQSKKNGRNRSSLSNFHYHQNTLLCVFKFISLRDVLFLPQ